MTNLTPKTMMISRNELEELVEKSNKFLCCGASGVDYEWTQLQFESTTEDCVVMTIEECDGEFYITTEDYSDEDGETLDSFSVDSVEELIEFISNL